MLTTDVADSNSEKVVLLLCICAGHFFFPGVCGFARVRRVATMTNRKNKRPRVVFNDKEEEVLQVEEDGPLTMWDLPFDVAVVPKAIHRLVLDAFPFLCGQRKARYDVAFFQCTLGLCNKGYKLFELSSDKICNKSSFLEVWPMQDGRYYIQDCEDKV